MESLKHFLFGDENAAFLLEVLLRSFIMFGVTLLALKLTGKRGVKQLSVFEMVLIISMGSAAGDPMFYKEVGILTTVVVISVIILSYRIITHFTATSEKFENLVEGKVQCIINEGEFSTRRVNNETLAHDEFFAELRQRGVSHLGQVRYAYIETSGKISVFFYRPEEVRFGLPILPHLYEKKCTLIQKGGIYACADCAEVMELEPGKHTCKECESSCWIEAIDTQRVN